MHASGHWPTNMSITESRIILEKYQTGITAYICTRHEDPMAGRYLNDHTCIYRRLALCIYDWWEGGKERGKREERRTDGWIDANKMLPFAVIENLGVSGWVWVTKMLKYEFFLSDTKLLVDTHEKEINLSVSLTETRKREFVKMILAWIWRGRR